MRPNLFASALIPVALYNFSNYAETVNGGFTVIQTCSIVKCIVVYVMK